MKRIHSTLANNNEEDRISKLPDTLIHHILSFLDMKYVVQTSILSTKWRYIWTSVPILNFDANVFLSLKKRQIKHFANFVDMVLLLRDNSDIQKLHLFCEKESHIITSCVNTWILVAVRRNIQELHIEIYVDDDTLELPHCLYTCKSLTKLALQIGGIECSDIILPNSISLPRLKYLNIVGVSFRDEKLTNKLSSNCPVLESLIIWCCEFHKCLNISSVELKHFRFFYGTRFLHNMVRLYAPNLTSFICNGYISNDYFLENLGSLAYAKIYIDVGAQMDIRLKEEEEVPGIYPKLPAATRETYAQRMLKFLRGLEAVEDLHLSNGSLEIVSGVPELLDNQPPQFINLKFLRLQTKLSRDSLHGITYLLKISPNTEVLLLSLLQTYTKHPMYPFCHDEEKSNSAAITEYWEAGLSLPCVLDNLKFVQIRGVVGCVNELKFLEFLFKNASSLEEVVLYKSREQSCHRKRRLKKFGEKLQSLPRASLNLETFVL